MTDFHGDIQPPDQCDLVGYDFCLICGKLCPDDFLRLFWGFCADCLNTRANQVMQTVVVDIDRVSKDPNDSWRAARLLKAEYDARFPGDITFNSQWSERQVLGTMRKMFPAEYLAAKAIVRMKHGQLPFTHAAVQDGRALNAIKTVRNWLKYHADHADSAEDSQTDGHVE